MAISLGDAVLNITGNSLGLTAALATAQSKTQKSLTRMASAAGVIGKVFAAAGAAIAGGMGLAVSAAASFEQEIRNAAVVSGAAAGELGKLEEKFREIAVTASTKTVFSAKEVAAAITDIVRRGNEAIVMGDGLNDILNLAAANQVSVADATNITVSIMKIFGLTAEDTGRIVNVLTKNALDSAAEINDIGQAMQFLSGTARPLGVDLETTIALLGILRDRGLDAGKAGRGLRRVFLELARTIGKGGETSLGGALKAAGVSLDEINPKTRDVASIFRTLRGALVEGTDAAAAFGAVGFNVITTLADIGVSGQGTIGDFLKLRASLRDVGNEAERVARLQLDTLVSQIGLVGSNVKALLIRIGTPLLSGLQKFAEGTSRLVNRLREWLKANPDLNSAIARFAAVLGVALLVVGGFLVALPAIVSLLGAVGTAFMVVLSPVGLLVGLLAGGAAGAGAGLFALIRSGTLTTDTLRVALARVRGVFDTFAGSIRDKVVPAWNRLKEIWEDSILPLISRIESAVLLILIPIWEEILLPAIRAVIAVFTTDLPKALGDAAASLADWGEENEKLFRETLPNSIDIFGRAISIALPGLIKKFLDFWEVNWGIFKDTFIETMADVITAWDNFWSLMNDLFDRFSLPFFFKVQDIIRGLRLLKEEIVDIVTDILDFFDKINNLPFVDLLRPGGPGGLRDFLQSGFGGGTSGGVAAGIRGVNPIFVLPGPAPPPIVVEVPEPPEKREGTLFRDGPITINVAVGDTNASADEIADSMLRAMRNEGFA